VIAKAVNIGMFKLSFPNGNPLVMVQASIPIVSVSILLFGLSRIHHPPPMAVTKHAITPDSDVPALILGDLMEEPIQEATGSAKAKHSTAYRGIIDQP
jgi:hypothetical protein